MHSTTPNRSTSPITRREFDEIKASPQRWFPHLASMIGECWADTSPNGRRSVETADETALGQVERICRWLAQRSGQLGNLVVAKLVLEARWLSASLTNDQAETIMSALGLNVVLVPGNEMIGEPYLRLLQEVELAAVEALAANGVDLPRSLTPWSTRHECGTGLAE